MSVSYMYRCDPNKNIDCTKTGCKYNPDAEYPVCDLTSKPQYSTDGLVWVIYDDGESVELEQGVTLDEAVRMREGQRDGKI